MTAERVAAVLARHARCSDSFNDDDEWVAGCCCGVLAPAFTGDKDGWHTAHVAATLDAAGLLAPAPDEAPS